MKRKIAGSLMSALLCVSTVPAILSSCAADQAKDTKPTEQNAPASSDKNEQGKEDKEGGSQSYGKISKLVGNEITLDIAKNPDEADGAKDKGKGGKHGSVPPGTVLQGDGGSVQAGPPPGGDDGKDGGVMMGTMGDDGSFTQIDPNNMPKLELEYTGEQKAIVIPAGTQIFSLMGDNLKITDLKEGNVLAITFDKNGKIQNIMVME